MASPTKTATTNPMTHGLCRAVPNNDPVEAAATPIAEYTMDMPRTYISERKNAVSGFLPADWSLAACPPITATVIGIIGYTHGVKLSPTPAKKMRMSDTKIPLLSIVFWKPVVSDFISDFETG